MRNVPSLCYAIVIMLTGCAVAGASDQEEAIVPRRVIRLFNGKDLSGWTTWLVDTQGEDPRGVYSVHQGAIRISGDGFGYLRTQRAYKNYRLMAEVKWGTRDFRTRKGMARDSGIFLHSVGPDGNSYDCGWGAISRGIRTGKPSSEMTRRTVCGPGRRGNPG